MWLASYHDERASTGTVLVRAGLQRSVEGRRVLLLDDVFDSGLSLRESVRLCTRRGRRRCCRRCSPRKPWPKPRLIEPDFVAWEAPSRYLVGYGMDAGARYRGSATSAPWTSRGGGRPLRDVRAAVRSGR
jgi:hypoxanthine phosphoribosyltransferase